MNKKAFTLIELLVVIALIAVITGFVSVRFIQSYGSRQQDGYIKEFVNYLRYVQFKAIEDGLVYKLVLDEDKKSIESLVETEREFKSVNTPFSKKFSKSGNLSVQFKKGNEIYFFPDGTITKNTVTILDQMNELASVEIQNRVGSFKISHV